jgi:hypothetical protein
VSFQRDSNLEALRRQVEEDRTRVWTDPSMPHDRKQAQVLRLWQEFDNKRTALREGTFQGESGESPYPGSRGAP